MIDGLVAVKAPQEVIDAAKCNYIGEDSDDCEVWEENWLSVMLFLAVSTQWIISPFGGYIGINYTALQSTMSMIGIKKKKRASMFDDVRIMESAALEVLRDR